MTEFYGTVKSARNVPVFDNSLNLDIKSLFVCKKNQNYITNQLYLKNKRNGGFAVFDLFEELAPRLMTKFLKEYDIQPYIDDMDTSVNQLGADTFIDNTGHVAISKKRNWLETFRNLNTKFLDWSDQYFKSNTFVPYRAKFITGSINEFENNVREVMGSNLLADDIKELNVWQQFDINTDKNKFRYQNTIPVWQRSMNIRHVDRSNEGLREGNDPYRSSLDAPVYAYDMRQVRDIVGRYQDQYGYPFS
jgi:hypothetical protein